MGSFIRSVSHDLGAPLRAIDGFTEALQEECSDQLDAAGMEYVGELRGARERMRDMLDGLARLARVGLAEIAPRETDLGLRATAIADRLHASEPARHVTVVVGRELWALADPELIGAALTELLENSWRFTSGTTQATIEVGRSADGSFYVRDDGAGFDSSQNGELFVPFNVLHSRSDLGGLGIGLAMVGRIVHRHGGEVWAKGEPGRGATFSFTLPA